jgi:ATP-dependent protease Clp ATPase subunit
MEMKVFMDGYIVGQDDTKIALAVAVYRTYMYFSKIKLYYKEK